MTLGIPAAIDEEKSTSTPGTASQRGHDRVLRLLRHGDRGRREHDRGQGGAAVLRDEADPGRQVEECRAGLEPLLVRRDGGWSIVDLPLLLADRGPAVVDLMLLLGHCGEAGVGLPLARLDAGLAGVEPRLAGVEPRRSVVNVGLTRVQPCKAPVELPLVRGDRRRAGVELPLARLQLMRCRIECCLSAADLREAGVDLRLLRTQLLPGGLELRLLGDQGVPSLVELRLLRIELRLHGRVGAGVLGLGDCDVELGLPVAELGNGGVELRLGVAHLREGGVELRLAVLELRARRVELRLAVLELPARGIERRLVGGDGGRASIELALPSLQPGTAGVEPGLTGGDLRHPGVDLRLIRGNLGAAIDEPRPPIDELLPALVELALTVDELLSGRVELALAVDQVGPRLGDLRAPVCDLPDLAVALGLGDERIDNAGDPVDLRCLGDQARDRRPLVVRERGPIGGAEDHGPAGAGGAGKNGSEPVGDLRRGRPGDGDVTGRRAPADGEGGEGHREDRDPGRHDGEASPRGEPADAIEEFCHVVLRDETGTTVRGRVEGRVAAGRRRGGLVGNREGWPIRPRTGSLRHAHPLDTHQARAEQLEALVDEPISVGLARAAGGGELERGDDGRDGRRGDHVGVDVGRRVGPGAVRDDANDHSDRLVEQDRSILRKGEAGPQEVDLRLRGVRLVRDFGRDAAEHVLEGHQDRLVRGSLA